MNRMNEIYEGKWKVVKIDYDKHEHTIYTLVNIYNNQEITIRYETLRKIEQGKLTIGKLIWYRLRRGVYGLKSGI